MLILVKSKYQENNLSLNLSTDTIEDEEENLIKPFPETNVLPHVFGLVLILDQP